MKKIFFAFFLFSVLFSCTKETNTPKTDDNTVSNDVSISSFDCSGVVINGKLQLNKVTNNVYVAITYTGGNGRSYLTKSHTSTGVTGLSATLLAGTLANGEGVLTYNITGTPSSAGLASFTILLGGKSCSFSIKVDEIIQKSDINFTSIGESIGVFQNNIVDIDGNTYKTVKIGTQTWMAENLKAEKYNDGSIILTITDNLQWQYNSKGAWCYYNNKPENNDKFGKLYNWYAVSPITNGNKNICPTNWHIPSEAEWKVLIDYLGGVSVAGGKMKEIGTTSWNSPNKAATNISLFSAIPGGYRSIDGFTWGDFGIDSRFWSSTGGDSDQAKFCMLLYDESEGYYNLDNFKSMAFSVRCIKN